MILKIYPRVHSSILIYNATSNQLECFKHGSSESHIDLPYRMVQKSPSNVHKIFINYSTKWIQKHVLVVLYLRNTYTHIILYTKWINQAMRCNIQYNYCRREQNQYSGPAISYSSAQKHTHTCTSTREIAYRNEK